MKTLQLIITALMILFMSHTYAQKSERTVDANFSREKGTLNNFFNECVGAGRANEGLRADWQQQLTMIKETCGFRYIRFHGLLSDDMGVYKLDNEGKPMYN